VPSKCNIYTPNPVELITVLSRTCPNDVFVIVALISLTVWGLLSESRYFRVTPRTSTYSNVNAKCIAYVTREQPTRTRVRVSANLAKGVTQKNLKNLRFLGFFFENLFIRAKICVVWYVRLTKISTYIPHWIQRTVSTNPSLNDTKRSYRLRRII